MRRILAIVLAGLTAAAVAAAAATWWNAFEPPAPAPHIQPASIGPPDWRETRRYSVNRILIVEGECSSRERAEEIARSIVETGREAYDEVLVYVRTRGDRSRVRRVQWRPPTGYRVLDF